MKVKKLIPSTKKSLKKLSFTANGAPTLYRHERPLADDPNLDESSSSSNQRNYQSLEEGRGGGTIEEAEGVILNKIEAQTRL